MSDDEPCVMWCGAKGHEGTQRHHGALINWRRRLKSYRKVVLRSLPRDDRPPVLRRIGPSELNRRIIGLEWRIEIDRETFVALRYPKGRPMVLGRGDRSWDGGPVGIQHRAR